MVYKKLRTRHIILNILKSLAVIGSNGMLGSDLVHFLSGYFKVTSIHRGNYHKHIGDKYDVLINANGNSKRYWANEYPLDDFKASTLSVYESLFDFRHSIYLYISSSDIYNRHNSPITTSEKELINPNSLTPYGLNKYLSEVIIQKYAKKYLILRSSMILGRNIKKGPLYDMLHDKPLFISRDSRIQIITTHEISLIIKSLIRNKITNDTFNVGGLGAELVINISKYIPKEIHFHTRREKQDYEMNVEKINKLFPLRTSMHYVQDYLRNHGRNIA